MQIFNRWGELIFQGDNPQGRGWDGKYGGKKQEIGVYVYLITATWKNGFTNTFQGNVTLLR
jgi:gliding motility-associated-like protein